MSKRLDLYQTLGVCPRCIERIATADRFLGAAAAPARAAGRAKAKLKRILARIRRRRPRRPVAVAPALPQETRSHVG